MNDNELESLHFRRNLCRAFIKVLDEMPADTPNRNDAIGEYKRQLASIDGRIHKITGQPPAVVVGLKTAKLTGNADMKK